MRGNKSILCSKRISEVAGTSNRSLGEKTIEGNTDMHAGFGHMQHKSDLVLRGSK